MEANNVYDIWHITIFFPSVKRHAHFIGQPFTSARLVAMNKQTFIAFDSFFVFCVGVIASLVSKRFQREINQKTVFLFVFFIRYALRA